MLLERGFTLLVVRSLAVCKWHLIRKDPDMLSCGILQYVIDILANFCLYEFRSHQVSIVVIAGTPYLVDVGFGSKSSFS